MCVAKSMAPIEGSGTESRDRSRGRPSHTRVLLRAAATFRVASSLASVMRQEQDSAWCGAEDFGVKLNGAFGAHGRGDRAAH